MSTPPYAQLPASVLDVLVDGFGSLAGGFGDLFGLEAACDQREAFPFGRREKAILTADGFRQRHEGAE